MLENALFIIVLGILPIILIILFSKKPKKTKLKNSDEAGVLGEELTATHLKALLRKDEYLLTNLLLPLKNGFKTEIDCILITRKGLFCVETKYWTGSIKGSDNDEYWVQQYKSKGRLDKRVENPVIQNYKHCKVVLDILNSDIQIYNIIIFSSLDNFDSVESKSCFTIASFETFYKQLESDKLLVNDIDKVYQTLKKFVATKKDLTYFSKKSPT